MKEQLSPAQAWEFAQVGEASIVDVRVQSQFALGHPSGALSLPVSAKGLDERLGVLLSYGTPVVLIAEGSEQIASAFFQLKEGGFATLGVVEDGMDAWRNEGLPMGYLAEVSIYETAKAVHKENTVVLDVRESIEWEMGHVPDALLISLGTLRGRLNELPRDANIIVICEAGVRSSSAASILQASGFTGVAHVPEGTGGYRRAGLSLQFTDAEPA